MAINSFLSPYAEGRLVLFCSAPRARDRSPLSCRQPSPPSQNSLSFAACQPTSAHSQAAGNRAAVALLQLPHAGMEGRGESRVWAPTGTGSLLQQSWGQPTDTRATMTWAPRAGPCLLPAFSLHLHSLRFGNVMCPVCPR